jgi:hypothetical protein
VSSLPLSLPQADTTEGEGREKRLISREEGETTDMTEKKAKTAIEYTVKLFHLLNKHQTTHATHRMKGRGREDISRCVHSMCCHHVSFVVSRCVEEEEMLYTDNSGIDSGHQVRKEINSSNG